MRDIHTTEVADASNAVDVPDASDAVDVPEGQRRLAGGKASLRSTPPEPVPSRERAPEGRRNDRHHFLLSFPKLAKRFGNAAVALKLRFPIGQPCHCHALNRGLQLVLDDLYIIHIIRRT